MAVLWYLDIKGYITKPPNNQKAKGAKKNEQEKGDNEMKLFKTLVTFLLGFAFMMLMILAATNGSALIASICGILSVILLVASGMMLEEKP